MSPVLLNDSREPWPHPWTSCFPADVRVVRGTLETGDMARSRYCGAFCIIVEGDLREVILQVRGVHYNASMSTIATWSRRYGPILFAGGQHAAADLAYRFLAGQVREINRAAKALSKITVDPDRR